MIVTSVFSVGLSTRTTATFVTIADTCFQFPACDSTCGAPLAAKSNRRTPSQFDACTVNTPESKYGFVEPTLVTFTHPLPGVTWLGSSRAPRLTSFSAI